MHNRVLKLLNSADIFYEFSNIFLIISGYFTTKYRLTLTPSNYLKLTVIIIKV